MLNYKQLREQRKLNEIDRENARLDDNIGFLLTVLAVVITMFVVVNLKGIL